MPWPLRLHRGVPAPSAEAEGGLSLTKFPLPPSGSRTSACRRGTSGAGSPLASPRLAAAVLVPCGQQRSSSPWASPKAVERTSIPGCSPLSERCSLRGCIHERWHSRRTWYYMEGSYLTATCSMCGNPHPCPLCSSGPTCPSSLSWPPVPGRRGSEHPLTPTGPS